MKKKKLIFAVIAVLVFSFATAAFANTAIKLYLNGEEIQTDVDPVLVNHRVLAPVRAISEALGMEVTWKNNAVYIESKADVNVNAKADDCDMRIQLLEQALAPKDALSAVTSWAEGVKTMNGALEFAVMSPALREENYAYFAELNWVTGTSSPWIESYEITEVANINDEILRYEVIFNYTDSTGYEFSERKFITVKKFEDNWFVSSIERVAIKGVITKVTLDDKDEISSIFVEDHSDEPAGNYKEGTAFIGEETKIYKGYSDTELDKSVLAEGTEVEVTYTDGPMIMIYPPQAMAKVIRVFDK
ncbi:MAG: copper amine oxidase N-terminal domain-containing protein [Clostridiaceae bacterium]|nr:copper amine oxidase N-terminal domain-containing protein [Clostridiaceae bacterium]